MEEEVEIVRNGIHYHRTSTSPIIGAVREEALLANYSRTIEDRREELLAHHHRRRVEGLTEDEMAQHRVVRSLREINSRQEVRIIHDRTM